jgi:hypothetical protein
MLLNVFVKTLLPYFRKIRDGYIGIWHFIVSRRRMMVVFAVILAILAAKHYTLATRT